MTDQLPLYEGLFLFSLNELGGRIAPAVEQLRQIFERVGARVEALYKWDERKLAYEIRGNKRGLYLLSYFRVNGDQIAQIERAVNLSDTMLRCLILRADHLGDIELEEARKREAQTRDAMALARDGEIADTTPADNDTGEETGETTKAPASARDDGPSEDPAATNDAEPAVPSSPRPDDPIQTESVD